MLAYFTQPELTASVMKDGYVYSNDVGYIDADGYVYMLRREDDVINYGGIKISPEEIEEVALRMPLIVDCECVPMPDAMAGQAPKLYVVIKSEKDEALNEFKQWLFENLDRNKIPKEVHKIDAISSTYNGKILRKQLRER